MKIETRKEVKEVITNIYIADDGTEFENKYDCEIYEYDLKTKQITELIEKLKVKVNAEWQEYEDSLYKMDVDSIITMSYETVMKEQLCCVLESETETMLEEWQIEKLLGIDNLLDFMYHEWLHYDSSEYDIYKEFVFGYWNWEYFNRKGE